MSLVANVNSAGRSRFRPEDFNPMVVKRKGRPMGARELVDTIGSLLGIRRPING